MDQPHIRDPLTGPARDASTEPVLRSRLLPRISFQSLLIFTTICGIMIAIVYAADQGGTYAAGAAAGLVFLAAMCFLSSLAFLFSWAVSFMPTLVGTVLIAGGLVLLGMRLFIGPGGGIGFFSDGIWLLNFQLIGWYLVIFKPGSRHKQIAASPFADDQLPPQILAPREPSA